MKNLYLIIIILLSILGCTNKNTSKNGSSITDSASFINSSLKDTVYIKKDSAIVPDNLYLNLDSIKIGEPFTDKANKYGYYRLLFSSSEETHSFYIEKIKIVGDGVVKLEKRFKITPQILGLEYDSPFIVLIRWQTPEIIEINVNGKRMQLDISKMKAIEIK